MERRRTRLPSVLLPRPLWSDGLPGLFQYANVLLFQKRLHGSRKPGFTSLQMSWPRSSRQCGLRPCTTSRIYCMTTVMCCDVRGDGFVVAVVTADAARKQAISDYIFPAQMRSEPPFFQGRSGADPILNVGNDGLHHRQTAFVATDTKCTRNLPLNCIFPFLQTPN